MWNQEDSNPDPQSHDCWTFPCSLPRYRGYLGKAWPFSRADSCFQIREIWSVPGTLKRQICREHTRPTFQWSFLILGNFGEAMKISIISNDQTCYLINVGSIIYSISCSRETTDVNFGCAVMQSNSVKISSQKTIETLKFFTFIIQLFEIEWTTIHELCRKSSGGCLPMDRGCWHCSKLPIIFDFSFPLAQ